MTSFLRIFSVGVALFLATGCGHLVYSSGPYRGSVVDAETKQPLVGAVVLAIWYREVPVGGHGPAVDYHDALEVLTDAQGEFTVPAKTHLTPIGKIREPEFVIYSPGYGYFPVFQVRPTSKALEGAFRQDTTVELPHWKTKEEQRKKLERLPIWTSRVPGAKMPNLIRLANQEGEELGVAPIYGKEKTK